MCHSRATVEPDQGRSGARQQRFSVNQEPVVCRQNSPTSLLRGELRIPVAVLPVSLQMNTFEGAKRGFGGRFGGRLQEDPPPANAENGSNLGPIVDRVRAVWRR